jgi:hypothetical protein
MEINAEIYSWLRSAGVIQEDLDINEEGLFTLPEDVSDQLESGLGFGVILKRLNKAKNRLEREITPMPELNSLKQVKSPAAKLYNWKILSSVLQSMGIVVDPDSRSLIVAGDRQIVIEVLKQIFEAEQKALKESKSKKTASVKSSKRSIKKKEKIGAKKGIGKESLYVEAIDPDKELNEVENCLEYLLVSFCKNFSLKPKQAAGLLTQAGKYLDHVVSKGLKGNHLPIQAWYQDIYSSISHLVTLILSEEVSGSVSMMLSALRSGFSSKSFETVHWCCRVFSKLASELINSDLLPPSWDWFVSENGGLDSCLDALTRFKSSIAADIVNVLVQFARNNFVELFTIQLRNYIPDSVFYFSTMNELLKFFCEIRTAKQELVNGGIVEYWFELGIRESHPDNKKSSDTRVAGINFLCDLWIEFPSIIENREEIGAEILNSIKRALRDRSKLLTLASIGKTFQLLSNFSLERNTFAPIIYKTLTFFIVENYRDPLVREMILQNFELIFDENPAIPVGILLEPLVKQLQVANDIVYSIADFDFFVKIAKHPRLNLKNAVQTMDILGKIYLNDETYMKASGIPFMIIANRFIESNSIQEYLFRLVKYGLGLAEAFDKKKKGKNQEMLEWEAKQKGQRDGMLDLCQFIIKMRGLPLNERILEMICELGVKYKHQGRNVPQFIIIFLRLFGDYQEILLLYEKDRNKNRDNFDSLDPILIQSGSEETPKVAKGKKNVKRLERGPMGESNESLGGPAVQKGRIMLEIEKIRQNILEKELEKKVKEENDKIKAENRRRALRKQVEKRRVELGVQTRSKDTKVDGKFENLSILRELSADERELINHVIKRYMRVLKLLFKKYSSTGYKKARVGKETFESAAEKNSTLSESEFYKLLKEQGLPSSMISLEDSTALLKSFCLKQKKPQIIINFQEFQEMIIQVAIFIYSKYPKDFSHLPPAISVKSLFDFLRSANSERGISTKFYDEPDPGVGDREIVRKLNILLEKDPSTQLPEGYKKVLENEIEIFYEVPSVLNLNESYNYAAWALDSILSKSIGVHFLEPIIRVREVYRARGILVKPQAHLARAFSENSSKFGATDHNTTFQRSYQPVMAFELTLTSGIKFELARLTGKYPNDLLYESAKLLDDLLHTVDAGSYNLISRNTKQKIQNKAQLIKEQTNTIKKTQAEEQERKRRLRKQIIEKKLKQAKEAREQKAKEEADKKKKVEEKMTLLKQKRSQKNLEMKLKREKEINQWKDKKKIEEEEQKKLESEKKTQEIERRKREREKFLKAASENMKKSFGDKHQEKEKEETKRVEGLKKLEELKGVKKKQLEQKFLKEKKLKEEADKQKEEFDMLKNDSKVKQVFTEFEKSLQLIFNHYCKLTPNKEGAAQSQLSFPGFNKFCTAFNIVPGLLTNDECLKMFRLTTRTKKQSAALAVDNEEFSISLLRIGFNSKTKVEKGIGREIKESEEIIRGLFEYLSFSTDLKKTRDMLKNIDLKSKNLHPREKKKLGPGLNKSISRELTPVQKNSRKKVSRKESDSLSFLLKSGLSD